MNETLVPELSKLPGFAGYYLIEGGTGILSSLGLFETRKQADESSLGSKRGPGMPGPLF